MSCVIRLERSPSHSHLPPMQQRVCETMIVSHHLSDRHRAESLTSSSMRCAPALRRCSARPKRSRCLTCSPRTFHTCLARAPPEVSMQLRGRRVKEQLWCTPPSRRTLPVLTMRSVRPEWTDTLAISAGRHPLHEHFRLRDGTFVPKYAPRTPPRTLPLRPVLNLLHSDTYASDAASFQIVGELSTALLRREPLSSTYSRWRKHVWSVGMDFRSQSAA